MPRSDRAPEWRWYLFATIAFGTSYAVLPLYSSNQNHHFLIGIARAGEGYLRDDWIAGTVDPFPLFTALVWILHRAGLEGLHYLVYLLLLGAYVYGLLGITERVFPPSPATRTSERLVWLAAICVLHNEVVGYVIGVPLKQMPWWQMTHWGVAEQEIFGHGAFQASSFGLLLPLALRWFLERRPVAAASLAAAVVVVHVSYALTAAALTLAFMVVERRRTGGYRQSLAIGSTALIIALPAVVYAAVAFAPTNAAVSAAAAAILARHLPQETDPSVWFGVKAALQVVLIVGGIGLSEDTDLLAPLAFVFAVGVVLSLIQFVTHSASLALLFPWRVSVLLVPVATALVVRIAIVRTRIGVRRRAAAIAVAVIAVSMIASSVRMALNFAYYNDYRPLTTRLDRVIPAGWRADFARALRPDTLPMMDFVRRSLVRGELFLIPPDLERFRLRSGAPAVVDAKSHPYKDVEVLEWSARLALSRRFYATGDCAVLREILTRYGVNRVVFDASAAVGTPCEGLDQTYVDPTFAVYRVGGTRLATR